jgi:broad specificity phosphatase PhoE
MMVNYDITFVRHGQTDLNSRKAFQGISDAPLNELGREQAKVTGKFLKKSHGTFDLALTSPLLRAIQTAEIIQQYIPIQFQSEPLLRERSYGIFEGKNPTELEKEQPKILKEYQKNKPFVRPPNGETALDVENRIRELFWDVLPKKYPNHEKILCVTHLNPVRSLLYLLKLVDIQIYYREFKNTSVTRITTDLKEAKILLLDFACMEDSACEMEIKNQDKML